MVETTFNIFDITVLSIIGLSGLLSFFRGFVREILSLGAWAGASIITVYMFPSVAAMIQPSVNNAAVASGFAAMGTFIASLIFISIINSIILRYTKKGSDVGLLDNFLGLGFGVFRGVLILSLAFYVMTLVYKPDQYPNWVQQSTTKDYVEDGARVIARLAPDYLKPISPLAPDEEENIAIKEGRTDTIPVFENENVESGGSEQGYEWMNIQELERIIENSQNNE